LAALTGDMKINMDVIRKCIEKGVVTDWFLFFDTALRISPPLLITEKEIIKACRVITESVHEISKTS
jgi:4-aminobutyrate aminotransferase-like enzyme